MEATYCVFSSQGVKIRTEANSKKSVLSVEELTDLDELELESCSY